MSTKTQTRFRTIDSDRVKNALSGIGIAALVISAYVIYFAFIATFAQVLVNNWDIPHLGVRLLQLALGFPPGVVLAVLAAVVQKRLTGKPADPLEGFSAITGVTAIIALLGMGIGLALGVI